MEIGSFYRHFKHGTIYKIVGFSKDSETTKRRVLYKAVTAPPEEDPWDRPEEMFYEMVERDGKTQLRFEPVESATMTELLETASKLAADPELRKKREDEVRAKLPPGYSFGIDEFGIGHYWGPLLSTHSRSQDAVR